MRLSFATTMAAGGSMRGQRATSFGKGTERLIAWNRAEDVVIVPGLGRLRRSLHLGKIHVVNEPAVFSQMAVLDIKVVHRRRTHLCHHRLCLVRSGRGDR